MGSFPSRQASAEDRKSKREAERRKAIAAAIRQLEESAATNVSFCKQRLGDDGAKEIAAALHGNSALAALDLSFSSIGSRGVEALATALSASCTAIQTVDFSGNRCGPEGGQAIANMIRTSSHLHTLNLAGMELEDKGLASLLAALEVNTSTTSLDIADNDIGPESAGKVREMLASNTSLVSLNFSRNNLWPEGGEAVAPALEANACLHALNLSYSRIRTEGAIAIGQALRANSALTSLDLTGNGIGDPGAFALASALRVNSVLTNLALNHNAIGPNGGIELLGALEENAAIVVLGLRGNPVTMEVLSQITAITSVEGIAQRSNSRDQTKSVGQEPAPLAATQRLALNQRRQRSLGSEHACWCGVQLVRGGR